MFRYELDENNTVLGYVDTQVEPCLFQPHHPDGRAWADASESDAWGAAWVAHMTDPENNEFPA